MSRAVPRRSDWRPWPRSVCRSRYRRGPEVVRLPCPEWCTVDHVREQADYATDEVIEHAVELGEGVWLCVVDDKATGVRGETTIEMDRCEGVNSAQARRRAAALIAAADLYDTYGGAR